MFSFPVLEVRSCLEAVLEWKSYFLEVAKLFAEAGRICIACLISPEQEKKN